MTHLTATELRSARDVGRYTDPAAVTEPMADSHRVDPRARLLVGVGRWGQLRPARTASPLFVHGWMDMAGRVASAAALYYHAIDLLACSRDAPGGDRLTVAAERR